VTARSSLSFAPASRIWRVVALAVTIAGVLAIAGTYSSFSNTNDEPAHIGAGVEWLSGHRDFDVMHPPLGRIAAAAGPYLRGARAGISDSATEEGVELLGRADHYRATLTLARLGELPFFVLLCAIVWAWGKRLTDERGGAIAVLLLATNPSVLAHAGLATTDIALAATLTAAFFAFVVWLDRPHWATALALGAAIALALATDYSAIAIVIVALPMIYTARRRRNGVALWADFATSQRALAIVTTAATMVLLLGAIYHFRSLPFWFRGLEKYLTDNTATQPAFLFGERSPDGWWYYYPVALLVKTPLPLLLLGVLGAAAAVRDLVRRVSAEAAGPCVAIVAVVVVVTIIGDEAGVRLVLPVFGLLALLGAVAAVELWDAHMVMAPVRRLLRPVVAATLVAAVVVPMRAHPDHLAYFNPIAGDQPELILVDSNLDWGQDLYRLSAVMKRMRIESIAVAYYGSAPFDAAGVRNARPLAASERPTGWIAASQTMLAGVGGDGAYEWLNELQPVGRVGSSLVLYYVPPRRRYRR
jgi:dolichyl-phosphate-mannose-protein mannosyltransferase